MKNVSTSLRLTWWFSAIFLAGFVVFGLVMQLDLAFSLSRGRDRTLTRRAGRLVDLLNATTDESADRRAWRFREFADAMPEGNLIHLFDRNGKRLLPADPDPADFPWPPSSQYGFHHFSEVIYHGRHYRVFIDPVSAGSGQYSIGVAGQLEDNRWLLSRFSTGLYASTPALLVISALGGYFLSRRVLRPIDRITNAVRSISIGSLSGRLPITNNGDELQRLAETFNNMLARLENSVNQIQRFTADASHELRSPISFMRTVAEVGLGNSKIDPESREAFQDILDESAEAARLLEEMLVLARADSNQSSLRFEVVNLADLMEDIGEKARPLTDAKRQRLAVDANGQAQIQGDRSSVRRLLWTLVDNAINYTPERGRIELRLDTTGSEARVIVRDDGIGIPQEMLPRIFDRFFSRRSFANAGARLRTRAFDREVDRRRASGDHFCRKCGRTRDNVPSYFSARGRAGVNFRDVLPALF